MPSKSLSDISAEADAILEKMIPIAPLALLSVFLFVLVAIVAFLVGAML